MSFWNLKVESGICSEEKITIRNMYSWKQIVFVSFQRKWQLICDFLLPNLLVFNTSHGLLCTSLLIKQLSFFLIWDLSSLSILFHHVWNGKEIYTFPTFFNHFTDPNAGKGQTDMCVYSSSKHPMMSYLTGHLYIHNINSLIHYTFISK